MYDAITSRPLLRILLEKSLVLIIIMIVSMYFIDMVVPILLNIWMIFHIDVKIVPSWMFSD